MLPFYQRFFDFCEANFHLRRKELSTESYSPADWHRALESVVRFYSAEEERRLLLKALSDPYFPLSKLRKLNFEGFVAESKKGDVSQKDVQRIVADHLLKWAEIFVSIRQDLKTLEKRVQLWPVNLGTSAGESLPTTGWCTHCGSCCEIRGGPAEFTGSVEVPQRWIVYFCGDGCNYQRFCPFLCEYFAGGTFFCSVYQIKPRCCWEFDREECEFLQKDLAREQSENQSG
jgi:hypothetical protein